MKPTEKYEAWNILVHKIAFAYHEDGDTDFDTNAEEVAERFMHSGAALSYLKKNRQEIMSEVGSIKFEEDY